MPDSPGRIDVERDGLIAIVTIANEARANSLDDTMLSSLAEALQADSLGDARAVVLTGAGDRNFSGGVDLQARDGDALTDAVRTGERLLGRAAAAVEGCPVPVVCALNGNAFGGAADGDEEQECGGAFHGSTRMRKPMAALAAEEVPDFTGKC